MPIRYFKCSYTPRSRFRAGDHKKGHKLALSAPGVLPNGKGADGLVDSPAEHAEGLALLAGDAHKAAARHRKLAGTLHRAQLRIGQPAV